MEYPFSLSPYIKELNKFSPIIKKGKVEEVIGFLIKAYNPGLKIGSECIIYNPDTDESILGEAVGFKGKSVLVMPLGNIRGIGPKSLIYAKTEKSTIKVGYELLGRVIDGLGNPLDELGPIEASNKYPLYPNPINPLHRNRVRDGLDVGVRAINGLLTVGKGQRIGILAGSGVGKSVLLGMMSKNTTADISVIALIGERGREVKEFIEKDLGPQGLERSIVITATSDQSPLVRLRGAYLATSIAEFFREEGKDVLLMMDSATRFAMAQREIGLAVGEPPTTKGYPPSVFSLLPALLERTGNTKSKGSLTAFYTVLTEADDPNDPIGDTIRSIVDGHIILSRKIAAKGHFPAIDILNSKSRVMNDVASPSHIESAIKFNETLATYSESEDLIRIGAYAAGSDTKIDYSINKIAEINAYLKQGIGEATPLIQCEAMLEQLMSDFPQ